MYLDSGDELELLQWLNSEPVVWIVKDHQSGPLYHWRVQDELSDVGPGSYTLWHPQTEPLRIPSGMKGVADELVADPYSGWAQTLEAESAMVPWFGVSHAGTFDLRFFPTGTERAGAIGRSGFSWIGNYFSVIGNSASPVAEKWWARLRRQIKKQSSPISWPPDDQTTRNRAYVFPRAFEKYGEGCHLDVNPTLRVVDSASR